MGLLWIFYDLWSLIMIFNIKLFKNGFYSLKKKKIFFCFLNKFGLENYFYLICEIWIKWYDYKLNVFKLVLYFDLVNFLII